MRPADFVRSAVFPGPAVDAGERTWTRWVSFQPGTPGKSTWEGTARSSSIEYPVNATARLGGSDAVATLVCHKHRDARTRERSSHLDPAVRRNHCAPILVRPSLNVELPDR